MTGVGARAAFLPPTRAGMADTGTAEFNTQRFLPSLGASNAPDLASADAGRDDRATNVPPRNLP
jgi:hypothetical protein